MAIYNEADVELDQFLLNYDEVMVATGNNYLHEEKIKMLNRLNIPLATIIHASAIIRAYANIEVGCTVWALSVIHTNAHVKTGCIINTGVIVEHDCIIHEYVNLCPNVSIVEQQYLEDIAFKINEIPRKMFAFQTPYEVELELT